MPKPKTVTDYLEQLQSEGKISAWVEQFNPHRFKLKIKKETVTINGGNEDVVVSRLEDLKL